MAAGVVFYRVDGGVDFKFRFAWLPEANTWRVYILDQPKYHGRDSGAVTTHRLGLPTNPHICWAGQLQDYEDARWVASIWANGTMAYIRTGAFPGPPAQRINPGDRSVLAHHRESELRAALTEGSQPRTQASRPSTLSAPPVATGLPTPGPIRRILERIR